MRLKRSFMLDCHSPLLLFFGPKMNPIYDRQLHFQNQYQIPIKDRHFYLKYPLFAMSHQKSLLFGTPLPLFHSDHQKKKKKKKKGRKMNLQKKTFNGVLILPPKKDHKYYSLLTINSSISHFYRTI